MYIYAYTYIYIYLSLARAARDRPVLSAQNEGS